MTRESGRQNLGHKPQPNQAALPLAASGRSAEGSSVSTPGPTGSTHLLDRLFDARLMTKVPQSLEASSTLSPSFFRSSKTTWP